MIEMDSKTKEEVMIDKVQSLVIEVQLLHRRLDVLEKAIEQMVVLNGRVIDILAGNSNG